jgi:hypothetical protein
MATGQKNISIGTSDNAEDGITIREAFRIVRKNFAEIYGDTDSENLTDTETVTETNFNTHIVEKIQDTVGSMVSGNTETNITVTYDDTNGNLDFVVAADITDVNAGDGMTGTSEGGGAATLNVVGGDGITVSADEVEVTVDDTTIELSASDGSGALKIKDGGVDHDQLANRYTRVQTISSTTSPIDLECDDYTAFNLTGNLGTVTLNLNDLKTGQVVDILLSGSDLSSAVITLADSFTTSVISKVGSTSLDTSATNLIQVVCVDDTDGAAIVNYSIATYTTNTTP